MFILYAWWKQNYQGVEQNITWQVVDCCTPQTTFSIPSTQIFNSIIFQLKLSEMFFRKFLICTEIIIKRKYIFRNVWIYIVLTQLESLSLESVNIYFFVFIFFSQHSTKINHFLLIFSPTLIVTELSITELFFTALFHCASIVRWLNTTHPRNEFPISSKNRTLLIINENEGITN